MTHTVFCQVLKREAPALEEAPYPGEIGRRIVENVSAEGWRQWLERLTTIINENRLSTADPRHLDMIEEHMLGFLFNESDQGGLPSGYVPRDRSS